MWLNIIVVKNSSVHSWTCNSIIIKFRHPYRSYFDAFEFHFYNFLSFSDIILSYMPFVLLENEKHSVQIFWTCNRSYKILWMLGVLICSISSIYWYVIHQLLASRCLILFIFLHDISEKIVAWRGQSLSKIVLSLFEYSSIIKSLTKLYLIIVWIFCLDHNAILDSIELNSNAQYLRNGLMQTNSTWHIIFYWDFYLIYTILR